MSSKAHEMEIYFSYSSNQPECISSRQLLKIAIRILSLVLISTCSIWSTTVAEPLSVRLQEFETEVQLELDRTQAQLELPGLSISIYGHDGRTYDFVSGYADKALDIKLTPSHRMHAGSQPKVYVAATAVMLEHEGKLDLDSPIGKWLLKKSYFKYIKNPDTITVRDLLNHSAGFQDNLFDGSTVETSGMFAANTIDRNVYDKVIEVGLTRSGNQEDIAPPRDVSHYSDIGYLMAGQIIEYVINEPIEKFVQQNFLYPNGLWNTTPAENLILTNVAQGYTDRRLIKDDKLDRAAMSRCDEEVRLLAEHGKTPTGDDICWSTRDRGVVAWKGETVFDRGFTPINFAYAWVTGQYFSTPHDLAHWAWIYYGGRLIKDSYVTEIATLGGSNPPVVGVSVGNSSSNVYCCGLGLFIYKDPDVGIMYGHNGGMPGFSTSDLYVKRFDAGIATMTNIRVKHYIDTISLSIIKIMAKYPDLFPVVK